MAYVGEGDDISARLRMHSRPEDSGGKDFWDRVVVLTSKDANLTKAHARYLESRFIALATQAKRSRITNNTAPPAIQLPEADISDMEHYISQALIVFPVLGINIFRTPLVSRPPIEESTSVNQKSPVLGQAPAIVNESPIFELTVPRHGIVARGQELDGEFTVLEDSLARAAWVGTSRHPGYEKLHESFVANGTLQPIEAGLLRFTRSVAFNSPSAAGAVVTGRACNGRTAWVSISNGQTFGAWQTRGIDETQEYSGEPAGNPLNTAMATKDEFPDGS
jgi:hypothetical protein